MANFFVEHRDVAPREIDEISNGGKCSGLQVGVKAADGCACQASLDAKLQQSGGDRSVFNSVRGQFVPCAMPRDDQDAVGSTEGG